MATDWRSWASAARDDRRALVQLADGTLPHHHDTGVMLTFITLGILYFCFMMFGVFTVRVPPQDWTPEGYKPAIRLTPAE